VVSFATQTRPWQDHGNNMAGAKQEDGKSTARTWQDHGNNMARAWHEHGKSSRDV
jgi:hypothetical protein